MKTWPDKRLKASIARVFIAEHRWRGLAEGGASPPPRIERFMKTQIDIKSAIIGLLAGIVAMLAVGASSTTPAVGRYQVGGTASQG
jgi:hypothetical protein